MDHSSLDPKIRLNDEQRLDWLQLIRSDNVGPRTFRTLINHFGSAAEALNALPDLARRGGAARPIKICPRGEAEAEMARAAKFGVRFVAPGESGYPARLHEIDDTPPLAAIRGNPKLLETPAIAIVGSRNASAAGQKMAAHLSSGLAANGYAVVSGLARGIDAAAHRASLSQTIAVLAGGHDRIYPPEHDPLVADIIDAGGAVFSEMPMGWSPRSRDFPRRNRLISGISLGIVAVEAAQRSGSLITARVAGEQGREVFAVPGSPLDPRAAGTNALLKQGATLVTELNDIIEAVAPILDRPLQLPAFETSGDDDDIANMSVPDDSLRARIVNLLGPSPVGIDDLIRVSATPAQTVRMVLLELELAGRIERHGNGLISLVP